MKKIFLHTLLLFSATVSLFGQAFVDKGYHPRLTAVGRSVFAMTKDASLIFYNPSSIGFETSANVFANYTNLYPEIINDNLNVMNAGGAYALGEIGVVGVAISQFAPNFWNEQTMIGSFATRMFDEDLSVGGSVKILRWSSDAPQGTNAVPEPALSFTGFTFDAGAVYVLRDVAEENDLYLGVSVSNLTQPSVATNGSADAALPMAMNVGANYHSKKYNYNILAGAVITNGDLRITFGGELLALRSQMMGVTSEFFVRAGAGRITAVDSQGEYNGGFGLKIDRFIVDYAYSYQAFVRFVGGISSISVGYEW